jgi:hypothetical protein
MAQVQTSLLFRHASSISNGLVPYASEPPTGQRLRYIWTERIESEAAASTIDVHG